VVVILDKKAISHRGESERVAKPLPTEFVTGNYFSTFGIRPLAGRLLSVADDHSSSPPVAVLSYQAWQATYGSDPAVVGSTFVIQGHTLRSLALRRQDSSGIRQFVLEGS
jgi:MacB-like periplasmic core domain